MDLVNKIAVKCALLSEPRRKIGSIVIIYYLCHNLSLLGILYWFNRLYGYGSHMIFCDLNK